MDPNKHAQLVVAYYQQKLAEAEEQNANLWAQNQLLGEQVKTLQTRKDPNEPEASSDLVE